eukprot:688713-Hanusia_phi.AAC.4
MECPCCNEQGSSKNKKVDFSTRSYLSQDVFKSFADLHYQLSLLGDVILFSKLVEEKKRAI